MEKITDYDGVDAWIDLECVTAIALHSGQRTWTIHLVGTHILVSEATARHVAELCSK